MQKAEHPTPKGYRRLKPNEVILPTDLFNCLSNTLPFEGPRHGFLKCSCNSGRKVSMADGLAFYRQENFVIRTIKKIYAKATSKF